jgi:FtsZ-binding cell division protein ZapB
LIWRKLYLRITPYLQSSFASIIDAKVLNRLTKNRSQPYSIGMISEFNDLSDKIDRLAELTQSLRRENATLRQSNALLAAENVAFMERLSEAQRRVEALLASIPPEPGAEDELLDAATTDDEAAQ